MPYVSKKANVDDLIDRALIRASNRVNGKAVGLAKPKTPRVTGTAQGSISLKPAEVDGSKIVSEFGSYNVNYFIFLELGTRFMRARHILQTSADDAYRELPQVIKEELKAVGL